MSTPSLVSDARKAEIVALAQEVGYAEAGRQTGVARATIRSWCLKFGKPVDNVSLSNEGLRAARQHQKQLREEIRVLLLERTADMLARMDEPEVDFRGKDADEVVFPKATGLTCRAFATAAAILLDKYRLEQGEVQASQEFRHEFADKSDADLMREAEALLREGAFGGDLVDAGVIPAEECKAE
jgi:hypothetical protein